MSLYFTGEETEEQGTQVGSAELGLEPGQSGARAPAVTQTLRDGGHVTSLARLPSSKGYLGRAKDGFQRSASSSRMGLGLWRSLTAQEKHAGTLGPWPLLGFVANFWT